MTQSKHTLIFYPYNLKTTDQTMVIDSKKFHSIQDDMIFKSIMEIQMLFRRMWEQMLEGLMFPGAGGLINIVYDDRL